MSDFCVVSYVHLQSGQTLMVSTNQKMLGIDIVIKEPNKEDVGPIYVNSNELPFLIKKLQDVMGDVLYK